MVVLKIVGKILLMLVWILVAMAWLLVKVIVAVYSYTRGVVAFGLVALMVGTLLCYHDWRQIIFLLGINGMTLAIMLIGVFIETSMEMLRSIIGRMIFA